MRLVDDGEYLCVINLDGEYLSGGGGGLIHFGTLIIGNSIDGDGFVFVFEAVCIVVVGSVEFVSVATCDRSRWINVEEVYLVPERERGDCCCEGEAVVDGDETGKVVVVLAARLFREGTEGCVL